MRGSKNKRYTPAEDAVILDAISQNPGNLDYAFQMAERQLRGRKASSISGHYYSTLKKGNRAMMLVTSKGAMANTKNTKAPKKQSLALEIMQEAAITLNREEKIALAKILMRE